MKWTVRILTVVALLLVGLLAGLLIRGKNSATVEPTTTTTLPATIPTGLVAGCHAVQPFAQQLSMVVSRGSGPRLSDITGPGTYWYTVSGLQTDLAAYPTIEGDATAFVQATSLAMTNGDLSGLGAATDTLRSACIAAGVTS